MSYLQTRIYRRPMITLTSEAHSAAGGVVRRIAPESWRAGSAAYDYVCFENNPLLEAIRGGQTRYRFTDFAPREQAGFGSYWDAMSEAHIGEPFAPHPMAVTGPSRPCIWDFASRTCRPVTPWPSSWPV